MPSPPTDEIRLVGAHLMSCVVVLVLGRVSVEVQSTESVKTPPFGTFTVSVSVTVTKDEEMSEVTVEVCVFVTVTAGTLAVTLVLATPERIVDVAMR